VCFLEAGRVAQGLPPRVSDPTVLKKVAAILADVTRHYTSERAVV
jgi:hypothetical protein